MGREPRVDQSGDADHRQNTEKLPAGAISKIRNESFELPNVFEKRLGPWLHGHNAIKRTAQEQCTKYRVYTNEQPSNEVHLVNHRWWKVLGLGWRAATHCSEGASL